MLLGSGGLLLCSGGVFFRVGQRHNNRMAFSLGSVPRTRWWANLAFSLGSVLGLLLANDIYIRSSVFFGVCSGAVVYYGEIIYILVYKGECE
jgi:hypothetical protein